MIISYIGNFEPPFSTENDVRKAFEELGHEVIQLQEDKTTWEEVRAAALNSQLLLITSTWDEAQPFKETIETLRLCALRGIPTATYHLDVFWGADRGERKWWLNPMFFTRYVFTVDGDHDEDWTKLGIDHHWLPPGVRHDAVEEGKFNHDYACDVAFVGANGETYHTTAWPYRKQLVDALREMCKRNNWHWHNPGGDEPKIDRDYHMNDFYASAKVTVGDSLCLAKEASNYWSDRVPEATGRGGFLIMPRIEKINDLWDGSIPMYAWDDFDNLEKRIRYYLENEDKREKMRLKAHRITKAAHTYVSRAKEILEVTDVLHTAG